MLDDFRQSYASVFAAMQRVSKRSTLLPNSATTVAESRDHSKSRATEAEVKHMLAFLVVPTGHDVVGKESITADCLLQMVNRSRRSKVMMFLWQCPIMLMSYSWALFIVALTLHVLRPFLLRQVWNDDSKVRTVALLLIRRRLVDRDVSRLQHCMLWLRRFVHACSSLLRYGRGFSYNGRHTRFGRFHLPCEVEAAN